MAAPQIMNEEVNAAPMNAPSTAAMLFGEEDKQPSQNQVYQGFVDNSNPF